MNRSATSFNQNSFTVDRGEALPFGSTITDEGVNFAIYSEHATDVTLVLFETGVDKPVATFHLSPDINTTGYIWHILVKGIDPDRIRYGYTMDMQPNPNPDIYCYNTDDLLIDPYAKAISGAPEWGKMYTRKGEQIKEGMDVRKRRSIIDHTYFDWGDDKRLCTPEDKSIIYELHVRGFTKHESSGVEHKGTFLGLCEKIPYLQELGITAVELLPVFEFEETDMPRFDPTSGKQLVNFWGYDPITFFAPKASYASNGVNGQQINEFKQMVKAFHEAGIEVILDVVFNHTAEGEIEGYHTFNYRGIDNPTYYLMDEITHEYKNYTGCGNTFNCNHPVVRDMIIDALHHWVVEYHIDGFRFDLASILGRGENGEVLANPPILERIASDPVLAKTKLIAEAWDAAGLYQVGSFPAYDRWTEWNGKFRDDIRAYIKGDEGKVWSLAQRLMGSPDIYRHSGRSPFYSVNFVTCHDGFTLRDLVSYNEKHNIHNGEDNRDGSNDNQSWNCGVEGETEDLAINALRLQQQKNIAYFLILSDGVPMILAGDEFGRTQKGSNNAYCQDNEISWVDWRLAEENKGLLRFFKHLIAHKKNYSLSKYHDYIFDNGNLDDSEVCFHGARVLHPDWSESSRTLGVQVRSEKTIPGSKGVQIVDLYTFSNAHWENHKVELPKLGEGKKWYRIMDTSKKSPEDFLDVPVMLEDQYYYSVAARSTIMLEGR